MLTQPCPPACLRSYSRRPPAPTSHKHPLATTFIRCVPFARAPVLRFPSCEEVSNSSISLPTETASAHSPSLVNSSPPVHSHAVIEQSMPNHLVSSANITSLCAARSNIRPIYRKNTACRFMIRSSRKHPITFIGDIYIGQTGPLPY